MTQREVYSFFVQSGGSGRTPRRVMPIQHYDSFTSSYSSSNEHIDTPTTSECTSLGREPRRRASDESKLQKLML